VTKVLDYGELELLDSCSDDLAVVNAARVSLNAESTYEVSEYNKLKLSDKDAGLIHFLMRERHGTPFEHGYFRFRVKAPLFVFREWHRHRVGHSYNEWSARYSQLMEEFYIPEEILTQTGKPGAYKFEPINAGSNKIIKEELEKTYKMAYSEYLRMLSIGVAKQHARVILPVGIYSEMIWSCNPRSLMHFLGLRNSEQAQFEIREYAKAAEDIFAAIMPVTHAAFISNSRTAP